MSITLIIMTMIIIIMIMIDDVNKNKQAVCQQHITRSAESATSFFASCVVLSNACHQASYSTPHLSTSCDAGGRQSGGSH